MDLGWLGYLLHILRLPVTPYENWYTFSLTLVVYFFIGNCILVPVCHLWVLEERNRGQLQNYLPKHFMFKVNHTEIMCASRCMHVVANK